jgi:hypothetical protein
MVRTHMRTSDDTANAVVKDGVTMTISLEVIPTANTVDDPCQSSTFNIDEGDSLKVAGTMTGPK